MTKVLSQILGAREPDFQLGLKRLEGASGNDGRDIRLTTEITAKTRSKLKELNLDPINTTGPELYYALNQKLIDSEHDLLSALKIESSSDTALEDMTRSIKRIISKKCFAIKNSVIKCLIKNNPPKKTMEALGYRSLDSMLKREPVSGILVASKMLESTLWNRAFIKHCEKLTATDLEDRPVSITILADSRWRDLSKKFITKEKSNLATREEIGSIVLFPIDNHKVGMLSTILLLIISSVNDILVRSSYLKLHQVRADFGGLLADSIIREPRIDGKVMNYDLSWRIAHEFLTEYQIDNEIPVNNLKLIKPGELLANLSPRLEFWRDTSYLAHLADGSAVSMNPLDVAINVVNELPFGEHTVHYLRVNLWRKLWQSYLNTDILREKLSSGIHLDLINSELEPEYEYIGE